MKIKIHRKDIKNYRVEWIGKSSNNLIYLKVDPKVDSNADWESDLWSNNIKDSFIFTKPIKQLENEIFSEWSEQKVKIIEIN